MNKIFLWALSSGAIAALSVVAEAHVSVTSGPATVDTNQEVVFGVGHGCEGADTYKVRVAIPAGVTSVRAMRSDFGKASFEKDASGLVTAVTWQKPDADVLPEDSAYYKLVLRVKTPAAPFTTVLFPTRQTCRKSDGTDTFVDWVAATEGGGAEPAPALKLLPAHRAGWNKFTVPAAIPDLNAYFDNALIVWKGDAAFSANPVTSEMITTTEGVTPLTSLTAGDEIWVKY